MLSFLYSPTLTSIHDYWKTIALIIHREVQKIYRKVAGTHHLNSLNVKILHYQNQDTDIALIHLACSDFISSS